MLTRILRLLREQTLGALALFVALSGTAYAATALPRNSVGPAQLKTGAVRSVDVGDRSLLRRDFRRGQLPAGPRGPRGPRGVAGAPGPAALALRTPVFTGSRELGSIGGLSFGATCDVDSSAATGFLNVRRTVDTDLTATNYTATRFTQVNGGAVNASQERGSPFGRFNVVGASSPDTNTTIQVGILRLGKRDSAEAVTVNAEIVVQGPASGSPPGCEVIGTAVLGPPPS